MWVLSLPLLAVEERKGSKHDEQHEPHRSDREEDVQSPSILFLWWWRGGRMDRSGWKLLLWQHQRVVMRRADGRKQVYFTWTSDVEGNTIRPGAIASQ